ncbi:MAG: hypothetical protein NTV07_01695, partial [Candidatus Omnitrophica bacterium]|nr:hypothetical protein [Candidatus Omnitrophota bacterium]
IPSSGNPFVSIVEAGPREKPGQKGVPDMNIPLNQAEAAKGPFPLNTGVMMFSGKAVRLSFDQEFPIRVALRELPEHLELGGNISVFRVLYAKLEQFLTDMMEYIGRLTGVVTAVSTISPAQYGATKEWPHVVREMLKRQIISLRILKSLGIDTGYNDEHLLTIAANLGNLELDNPADAAKVFDFPKAFKAQVETGMLFRLVNRPQNVRIASGAVIYLNGDVEIEDNIELKGWIHLRSGGKISKGKDGGIVVTPVKGRMQLSAPQPGPMPEPVPQQQMNDVLRELAVNETAGMAAMPSLFKLQDTRIKMRNMYFAVGVPKENATPELINAIQDKLASLGRTDVLVIAVERELMQEKMGKLGVRNGAILDIDNISGLDKILELLIAELDMQALFRDYPALSKVTDTSRPYTLRAGVCHFTPVTRQEVATIIRDPRLIPKIASLGLAQKFGVDINNFGLPLAGISQKPVKRYVCDAIEPIADTKKKAQIR